MVEKRIVKVSKSSNGRTYENYRFYLPSSWKEHFVDKDLIILKFNQFEFPVNISNTLRITIPKALIKYYDINESFSSTLLLDTKSKVITVIS